MKFDVILANPPYDKNLHIKFLEKFFDLSDEIVSVQPLSWLTNQKKNKIITKKINELYCELVTIIPGEYFDAIIAQDMAIHYISNKLPINLILNGKHFKNTDEISKYSYDEYLTIVAKYIAHISKNNLDNNFKFIPGIKGHPKDTHTEYNPKDDWYIVKGAAIRGHAYGSKGKDNDFYTLIPRTTHKDFHYFYGRFDKLTSISYKNRQNISYYWAFNTKNEMENFINYIQSDFARCCLMLGKSTQNIIGGALKYIPWFDFSDEHFSKSPSEIDDYLFEKYIPEVDEETGITRDEISQHIEELLPDYYGIRKG